MWPRRIIALFLAAAVILMLPFLMFFSQINSTIANPGFYDKQMEKADVYNFVYDKALPAALDEAEDESNNPVDTDDIQTEIVSTARLIAPPQWLQENFEVVTDEIIPYFTGRTDEFTFTIELKDRIKAAPTIIKDEILYSPAMDSIYLDLTSYAADHVVENSDRLPYSPEFTDDEIETALKSIASKEWTALRIEETLNSVIPYFVLESETFTITIPVADRTETIRDELVLLLDREETYHYIVNEIVEPIVSQKLEPQVDLAFNVSLTRQEVIDGIEESLPREWFQQRLNEVMDAIVGYVEGESANTDITVVVRDRKPAIRETLVALAEDKVEAAFNALPRCSEAAFKIAIDNTPEGTLPECRPYGVEYEEYKEILEIDLTEQVESEVMVVIPDQWIYTQNDLIESMGKDNEEFLDEARSHVEYGWKFIQSDLLNKLDSENDKERLEDVRDWLGNGITVTQSDLEDEMNEGELDDFNASRGLIDGFLDCLWILWLIPVFLLVGIGYLGGRNWLERSLWALSAMTAASFIAFIATLLIYSSAIDSEFEEVLDLSEYTGFDLVMAEKMNEILANSADDFAGGMQTDALVMFVLSAIVLVVLAGWTFYHSRTHPQSDDAYFQSGN